MPTHPTSYSDEISQFGESTAADKIASGQELTSHYNNTLSVHQRLRRMSVGSQPMNHIFDEELIIRRAQAALDIELTGLRQVRRSLGTYKRRNSKRKNNNEEETWDDTGDKSSSNWFSDIPTTIPLCSTSTNPPEISTGKALVTNDRAQPGRSNEMDSNQKFSSSSSSCSEDNIEEQQNYSSIEYINIEGQKVILHAEDQMQLVTSDDGKSFVEAVKLCHQCRGRVVVVGMGKSGHVGKKIAATLASTGTPSFFLHAAEASHGDLGMITETDVVLAISNSGETPELTVILPVIKRVGAKLIAMTGKADSSLAKASHCVLNSFVSVEACPLNISPTASSTAQMALGDALAVVLLQEKGFTAKDFALRHPGGALGRKLLLTVGEVMRKVPSKVPIVLPSDSILFVMMKMTEMSSNTALVDCRGAHNDGDTSTNSSQKPLLLRMPITTSSQCASLDAKNFRTSNPSSLMANFQQQPVSPNFGISKAVGTPNSLDVSSTISGKSKSSARREVAKAAAVALSAKVWNMATPSLSARDDPELDYNPTLGTNSDHHDSFALPPSAAVAILNEQQTTTTTQTTQNSIDKDINNNNKSIHFGIFTDSDLRSTLAKLQQQRQSDPISFGSMSVGDAMSCNPRIILQSALASTAAELLGPQDGGCSQDEVAPSINRRVCRDVLIVVDDQGTQGAVVGIVSVADLVVAKIM